MAQSPIRLYLFDRLLLWYALLMVLLLATFGRPLSLYVDELIFYSATAALVIVIGRHLNERRSGWHHFLRLLYPVLLFTFLYRETGGMMFLFHDHFFDAQLTAFERAVFGVNPTLYIDRHLLNVFVNELLSLCYFLYYLMIPVFMLAVYMRGDFGILRSSMAAVSLTFFVSYLLFALYPVEGPRWFFVGQYIHDVEGPLFREWVNTVMRHAAVRGGCMPSSHFAVALVLVLFTARYYRRWLWLMVPVTTGLALGTVWGRLHYVSDVVVGGILGIAATLLVWRLERGKVAAEVVESKRKELRTHHAS